MRNVRSFRKIESNMLIPIRKSKESIQVIYSKWKLDWIYFSLQIKIFWIFHISSNNKTVVNRIHCVLYPMNSNVAVEMRAKCVQCFAHTVNWICEPGRTERAQVHTQFDRHQQEKARIMCVFTKNDTVQTIGA